MSGVFFTADVAFATLRAKKMSTEVGVKSDFFAVNFKCVIWVKFNLYTYVKSITVWKKMLLQ